MKYLFSKIALPNYIIWLLVLIPSYILKYQTSVEDGRLKPVYVVLEGLLWLIIAILLTAAIQYGIARFRKIDEHFGFKIIKFIGFVAIASLLFNLILWPILDVLYEYIQHKESPKEGNLGTNIYNWFVWIIWYSITTSLTLNNDVKKARVKNAELLANLKESQLNTLKGQINPHFMFNSLNNIRGLMLEDVDRARNMLTSLSETLRYSLTKSDSNAIALEDELEMVENYIEISKIQFEDRLLFESNIDKSSLNVQIPPMIIQMLVENAIKHGISNLKDGGKISLSAIKKDNQLLIEVANTGNLIQSPDSTQLGLKNIEQRLELLYGEAATFNLNEIENRVVATIKIPVA
ncbi:sensor histidine kinase [Gillisia sp. CAL575]|uniref:sensor histidine kinase n=1 Tax=Gillisia sp. CAL575 TaxID=985255 RepID=UPI0003A3DFB8|nr:histidine kinase [Gillisia sp. CAL575]